MTAMGVRALLAAVVLLAGGAARADDAFFRRCETLRRAALVGADANALGQLMLDGAQYIHSNGDIDDKAELMRRIASGELRYRSIVADAEHYQCTDTGCEVSGAQTLGVTAGERELTLRNQFRATWLRAGDACRLVAYQSSPLATPGQ
jgi:arabinogalactan endo-1,4-beta-galactosidase